MHHGEALKSNNDGKAVLGNCTDRALAGEKKKAEALMHFALPISLSVFFSLTVGVKSSYQSASQVSQPVRHSRHLRNHLTEAAVRCGKQLFAVTHPVDRIKGVKGLPRQRMVKLHWPHHLLDTRYSRRKP